MFAEVKNGYVHKDAVPMKTVKLTDALAVAYAAYRINGETYTKDTRRFSCDENKTQFDNKSLVRYYWENKLDTPDAKYLPTDLLKKTMQAQKKLASG